MVSAKYCRNCGVAVDAQARFCGHCGTRLAPAGPASASNGAVPGTAQPRPMQPAAPPVAPPLASAGPVTGAVPVTPPGVAPAGRLASTVVGHGRYVIDHPIGRGGMSAVYAARDLRVSGRLVAVKEMVDQFADPRERLEAERDFAREADLLAALRHPAIPAIIDRFSENSRHLLVMEYIAGENLEYKLAAHGPFDEEQVRAWALDLCSVLEYLHSRQPPVVFRDLKPGNVILQPDGRVRLVDFGIARLFKPQQKADTTALGTSGYASPEHYTGQTDARSDIYSLGATMHHLLTGRDPSRVPPFQFPPVRDLNPAVTADLAAIVEKAVRTDRSKRFASVDEMRQALARKRGKKGGAATPGTTTATLPGPGAHGSTPAPALPPGAAVASPASAPPPASAPALPRAPIAPAASTTPAASSPAPLAATNPVPAPPPIVVPRQVVVLEAQAPSKRLDYGALAGQVAAITGEDAAALRGKLQRGLPATVVLPPGRAVPALQRLAALGVRARVVAPGTVPVLLNGELRRRLDTTHQLVVRDTTVGPARTCRCRRCGYAWKTPKAVGDPVPLRCPNCRSMEWGRWRIFKCAWCGHEWDSADIATRRTERLFPHCPCCGLANWETGRLPVATGWLDRLIAALAGTA